uniref:NADH-ubiquinone oxidoreductase chain 4 n=1 Tax=Macrocheles muscaedomesticae TaxID=406086 RepID=A0A6B9WE62_9ACAR|nr:NADH dehydrogenase subunit 4 [Macrocheles muscaedomesticae]QHQ98530.1 NADH dehydrogenase subunit 4 [Macrocheles muscaedomesticae]
MILLVLLMMFCMLYNMYNMYIMYMYMLMYIMYVNMSMFSLYLNNLKIYNYMFVGSFMSCLLLMMTCYIFILMMMVIKNNVMIKQLTLYNFFYIIMMFGLFFFFLSDNLIFFFFFFELSIIPIALLIFLNGSQVERIQAGVYMMLYTVFASLPFLLLILFFWSSSSFSLLYNMLYNKLYFSSLVIMMLLLAFLVKLPMFGFHMWLPKAHVEAPVMGSMVLAAVLLKMGSYGLFRVMSLFYLSCFFKLSLILMVICLFGAVLVSINCFFQTDLKSLVAYSSVVHMGLMCGGIFTGSVLGAWGSMLMMLGHGLCSSALFCLINLMYERVFTRNIFMLKGLMLIYPGLVFFWFMFCVINMAAPPFMNIFSEVFLMGSILKWSFMMIFLLMLVSFLSAGYSLFLYTMTQHGKGWFLYSSDKILLKDYFMMMLHLYPLIFFILSMEVFFNWS